MKTAPEKRETRPRLTVGINTCITATRWPDPEAKFRLVRDLGVTTIQYSLDAFDPGLPATYRTRLAARIRRAADRTGLTIHSTFTGAGHHYDNLLFHPDAAWRRNAQRWFTEALHFTAAIGGRGSGGFLGALCVEDAASPAAFVKRRNDAIATLIRLGEEAQRLGLAFLLAEPMSVRREPPSTIAEALELVADVNRSSPVPLYLNLDVGHYRAVSAPTAGDRNPYTWIRKCGAVTRAIHLHQTDGRASRHWPFTPEYNAAGIITAERVLKAIAGSGAKEMLLLIEIFAPPYEPADDHVLEDLSASVRYWRSAIGNLPDTGDPPAMAAPRSGYSRSAPCT